MVIKDDVRARGEPQARGAHINPTLTQVINLFHESDRVEGHAITDHVDLARMQDAGRDQVQDVLLVSYDHGVARVRSALIANDEVCIAREEIDDLPFTLIAPLGTKYTE